MRIVTVVSLCVSFVVAGSALAQQPANPGPPASSPIAATPPPQLVDATGKVVGDIVDGGLSSAVVRYVLPTGDAVLLSATGDRLIAQSGALRAVDLSAGPERIEAWFTSTDCTGNAYVPVGKTRAALTKRQAISMPGLFGYDYTPSCQLWSVQGNPLFVTDPLACQVVGTPESPITFRSYYGDDPDNNAFGCLPVPLPGLTVPTDFDNAPFRVYHLLEDLDDKFVPPYYVP